MKQKNILLLTIGLLLLQLQTSLVAQEYLPFPDSNAVWKVYQMPYPPDEPWTAAHYDYISLGDTVVEEMQYTKLFKVNYNLYCSQISDTLYFGAYRNDLPNKTVYFYQGNEEKILYNFSLGIGDTIPFTYFIETDGEMVVCNIDSIELENGEYRKQFTYEFLDQEETCLYQVVEGIGFLGGLLEPMSTSAELMNSILLCYHENDSLVYTNPWWEVWGYNECEIEEDTCIINQMTKIRLSDNIASIIPNPITSTAILVFSNMAETDNTYSISIYNTIGKEVITLKNLHDGELIINSGEIIPGIYIYVLKQKNLIVQTGKIVVN
jgi:hypothetical protein